MLRPRCQRGPRTAIGRNHRNPTVDQFVCKNRQPTVVAARPAVFNRNILAIDETGLAQTLLEPRDIIRPSLRRCDVEKPDHRHHRLLRVRRERPRGRRSAEHGDEIAPLQLIELHLLSLAKEAA